MKLTPEELNKINRIPSLVKFCKTVIELSKCGLEKEMLPQQIRAAEAIIKSTQEPPKLKLITQ